MMRRHLPVLLLLGLAGMLPAEAALPLTRAQKEETTKRFLRQLSDLNLWAGVVACSDKSGDDLYQVNPLPISAPQRASHAVRAQCSRLQRPGRAKRCGAAAAAPSGGAACSLRLTSWPARGCPPGCADPTTRHPALPHPVDPPPRRAPRCGPCPAAQDAYGTASYELMRAPMSTQLRMPTADNANLMLAVALHQLQAKGLLNIRWGAAQAGGGQGAPHGTASGCMHAPLQPPSSPALKRVSFYLLPRPAATPCPSTLTPWTSTWRAPGARA